MVLINIYIYLYLYGVHILYIHNIYIWFIYCIYIYRAHIQSSSLSCVFSSSRCSLEKFSSGLLLRDHQPGGAEHFDDADFGILRRSAAGAAGESPRRAGRLGRRAAKDLEPRQGGMDYIYM